MRKIQFLSSKMYTSRLFLLYIYILNPKSNVFLFFFLFQVKSHTNARCAGRRSARAPTSLRTAGNTPDTNLSAATSAAKVSRERWI